MMRIKRLPKEKKARGIVWNCGHCFSTEDSLSGAFGECITLALQQAYNEGLEKGAEIAESVESVRHFKLGEPAHCIASTIRKEKR